MDDTQIDQSNIQSADHHVERALAEGERLSSAGRLAEAQSRYIACLEHGAQTGLTFQINQIVALLLAHGSCDRALQNYQGALATYQQADQVLYQRPGWEAYLPAGIMVVAAPYFDPTPFAAALAEATAVTFDQQGAIEQANRTYFLAISMYQQVGLNLRAAQTWAQIGVGAQRRSDWLRLQEAGRRMLELSPAEVDPELAITALRYLAQSASALGRLGDAITALERAVELEHAVEHPKAASDTKMLAEMRAELAALTPVSPVVTPDPLPVSPLAADKAAMVLNDFAFIHCGRALALEEVEHRSLFGLRVRRERREVRRWNVRVEVLRDRLTAAGRQVQCAVLDMLQTPLAAIRVVPQEGSGYEMILFQEQPSDEDGQRPDGTVERVTHLVDDADLRAQLDRWLASGRLVIDGQKLRIVPHLADEQG